MHIRLKSTTLVLLAIVGAALPSMAAVAQPASTGAGNAQQAPPPANGAMRWQANRWVDGPGNLAVIWRIAKTECEKRCLADTRCRFIEYHQPNGGKCNLWSLVPKTMKETTDTDVAFR